MTARFCSPSSELALRRLTKARGVMVGSMALAVVCHLLATGLRGTSDVTGTVRPLTTQFVKRQPRLTKPLELKKRPRPRRRALRREMLTVRARPARQRSSVLVQPAAVLRGLTRPSSRIGRGLWLGRGSSEPRAVAQLIHGSRDTKQTVDMSLEMMDTQSLDTGRYRAMIIQNPEDKRGIRGFLHLAVVIRSSAKSEYSLTAKYIQRVVEAVNSTTDIKTDLAGYYTFDSRMILKVPWLFSTFGGGPYHLTESEAQNLGVYLTVGGFAFVEPAWQHPWSTPNLSESDRAHRSELVSVQEMFKKALGTAGYEFGRDWDFEDLANSHPIYHCYFDLDGLPFISEFGYAFDPHDYVRGITLAGRLIAVIETADYEQYFRKNPDVTALKRFLVNTVVFALTQEGSITQQTMDSVSF